MDRQALTNEFIVKTTLELLQNVLPTNIMSNLEQLEANGNSDPIDLAIDLDAERFFFEQLVRKRSRQPIAEQLLQEPHFTAVSESEELIDGNSSLTYFEIAEQEMMESLPVTRDNILVWKFRGLWFFYNTLILYFIPGFIANSQRFLGDQFELVGRIEVANGRAIDESFGVCIDEWRKIASDRANAVP